jgi:hypothetical protein
VVLLSVLAGAVAPRPAHAQETERARAEFLAGAELVTQARWAEALAAFERSAKLRPHAVTTFDIGFCQRALGHYTRARRTFQEALRRNEQSPGELSDSLLEETRGYLSEIEGLLVRVGTTLTPATAALAVDGRPLLAEPGVQAQLVAGVRPPGPGEQVPQSFVLVLDPGPHVLTLRRKGFADAVVNRTFAPGTRTTLKLALDSLPASLEITAAEVGATVTVAGTDVGVAPLTLSRPAGSYRVLVRKPGFVPYESQVTLQPGESTRLRATLPVEPKALYERWWFWTAAGAVVGGAVLGTYLATRPDAERPPPNGGGLGWVVEVD